MRIDKEKMFNTVRGPLFGGSMKQSQVDGIDFLINAIDCYKLTRREKAYILATAYHETAHTMLPIEEYGKGKGRKYGGKVDIDGKPYHGLDHIYYGRGYVQLTWLTNYVKAKKELGYDFVNHPELALRPDLAARILVVGMVQGWFTGRKLNDAHSYAEMRRIVNGTDRAELIAGYAAKFEKGLL